MLFQSPLLLRGCQGKLFVSLRYKRLQQRCMTPRTRPLPLRSPAAPRQFTPRNRDGLEWSTMYWRRTPEFSLDDVEYLCSLVSVQGAGSWAVLLQVTGTIEWEWGYPHDGQEQAVTHSIQFSMPIAYQASMAETAMMSASPLWFKAAVYATKIISALKKLHEISEILDQIDKVVDERTFESLLQFLQGHERYLNQMLRSAGSKAI